MRDVLFPGSLITVECGTYSYPPRSATTSAKRFIDGAEPVSSGALMIALCYQAGWINQFEFIEVLSAAGSLRWIRSDQVRLVSPP